MIVLKQWYGRLGNNIQQIVNILHISLYYKSNVKIPNHKYFDTKTIMKNINDLHNSSNMYEFTDNIFHFYHKERIKNVNPEIFNENRSKIVDILKSSFNIKKIDTIDKNELLIHIRSGDIFNSRPHIKYVPPPLSYYVNIINNNYKKIRIISEDDKNPIIKKLTSMYPNITYEKNSLDKDIMYLLGSQNIVHSIGTFTTSLIMLSSNVKNFYEPSYYMSNQQNDYKYYLDSVNIHTVELNDYYSRMYPWKNNKDQIQLLLTY